MFARFVLLGWLGEKRAEFLKKHLDTNKTVVTFAAPKRTS
jgi:hypothetical protein